MPIKTMLILVLSAVAMAQDSAFRIQVMRYTNHDFPEIIKASMPVTPIDAKRDGVTVIATLDSTQIDAAEAVEITITYQLDGKRHKQVKTATLRETGCTPEPCRWVAITFDDIGKVDLATVRATAAVWKAEE